MRKFAVLPVLALGINFVESKDMSLTVNIYTRFLTILG